jgi:hypothetical protein
VVPRGAKWLLCSEFVSAPRHFAAFLHEPLFGRLCPECARSLSRLGAAVTGIRTISGTAG